MMQDHQIPHRRGLERLLKSIVGPSSTNRRFTSTPGTPNNWRKLREATESQGETRIILDVYQLSVSL